MTEVDTDIKDDEYLVRVKAQVMTRDDSTGGWVPMGGGGVSIVGLRKLIITSCSDDIRHDYLIHGQRMSDNSVVLNCTLKKDVQYTKANPTFHHWKTEEKRFGLTFQTHADARAFDKGVKSAVEDLLEGTDCNSNVEVGDDDVFMTLDLPMGRKDSSQSVSTISTTTSSPTVQSPSLSPMLASDTFTSSLGHHHVSSVNHQHLHRVHYITRCLPVGKAAMSSPSSENTTKSSSVESNNVDDIWVKATTQQHVKPHHHIDALSATDDNIEVAPDYSYVQFARSRPSLHEYSYPTIESVSKSPQRRDSGVQYKKQHNLDLLSSQPPLPIKKKERTKRGKKHSRHLLGNQRSRCVYCHEMFSNDDNHKGNCEDAPDKVGECIEKASCICCARGFFYHCMADADGDYGHPCVCDVTDNNNCKKWTALTILAFFVPCLWCYWPLTACHECGVTCGCCGSRHKAA